MAFSTPMTPNWNGMDAMHATFKLATNNFHGDGLYAIAGRAMEWA